MPVDNSSRFPKPLAADLLELSEGMAIVIDGDTAPKAIVSGQYLFIKNHSTLATGGYHATAAIAKDADVTSSNVTPDADGIVNGAFSSLSEQIGTLMPLEKIVRISGESVTFAANEDTKRTDITFADANKYIWFATQWQTTTSSFYQNITYDGYVASATKLYVYFNRKNRSSITSALTMNIEIIGYLKDD